MSQPYRLLAWPMSLYSGKTRAYLLHKRIDFVEQEIRLRTFRRIKRQTGAVVMPVVVTPNGEWLQDSSHIIDVLEPRHPDVPALPDTPVQRLVARLLEAWGDEFWLPSAMHYRWNFPENQPVFRREGGDHLLPFFPRFLKNRAIARGMQQMSGYLPGLGVTPEQQPIIEAWTEQQLDALNRHFSDHDYVLGGAPTLADYGLIAPLFAHLGRDPWPARELIAPRQALAAWIARMQRRPTEAPGPLLADDAIADTLMPALQSVFDEFLPFLQGIAAAIGPAVAERGGKPLPRWLEPVEFPLAGQPFRRNATTYSLWMAQRVLDEFTGMDGDAQARCRRWLEPLGGAGWLNLNIEPRLVRQGLRVKAA